MTGWQHGLPEVRIIGRKSSMFVIDDRFPDLGGNRRHGDIACFTPKLWKFVIERFAVQSLLDVGCGEGHAVAFFRSVGLSAHGIDGLRINVDRAVTPISLHDLKSGPFYMPVDLTICIEVVEHIAEHFVDHLMTTLCNGRLVMITHALPGQSGHHHVNEQNAEYWVAKFKERGYSLSREANLLRQKAGEEGHINFFRTSGLFFVRN